jgi:purine-cytosine permease-like protein
MRQLLKIKADISLIRFMAVHDPKYQHMLKTAATIALPVPLAAILAALSQILSGSYVLSERTAWVSLGLAIILLLIAVAIVVRLTHPYMKKWRNPPGLSSPELDRAVKYMK